MIREVTVNGQPSGVFVPLTHAPLLRQLVLVANAHTDQRWWWRRVPGIPDRAKLLVFVGDGVGTVLLGTSRIRPESTSLSFADFWTE